VLNFEDIAMGNVYFHTSAMLYRNDFFQADIGGSAVPAIFHEVRGDTIRLYVHASRGGILYIPQSMSVYDDHGGGIWTSLDWQGKQALLHNLYTKLDQHGYLANLGDTQAAQYLTQRLGELAAYTPTSLCPVSLYSEDIAVLPRHRLSRISHIAHLRDLELQLGMLVREERYEDAMQVLWRFVTAIAYDKNLARIGRSRRIASAEIDWQCSRLGEMIGRKFDALPQPVDPETRSFPDDRLVILVSGIVEDLEGLWEEVEDVLALCGGRRKISIISSELMPSSQQLCDRLVAEGIHVMRNTDDLLEAKVAWLMWHVAALQPSQILLNPARNDVTIAAALRREHAPRIHVLTALGAGFALCRLGDQTDGCVARRPYDLAYYTKIAPGREIAYIPGFARSAAFDSHTATDTPLISVSACKEARSLEQAYDYSFDVAILTVLRSGGARHIHIGPLSEATVNRIRKAVAAAGLPGDAFEHRPYTQDLAAELHGCGAAVFLQSFPFPEHRPLLAALAAGLPVIAHYSYLHPMLSLDDICYPGAAIWATLEDLGRIIRTIDPAWRADQLALVRQHQAAFGFAAVAAAALDGDMFKPVLAQHIPAVAVPETHHELRKLVTELTELTIFEK
jgi:3',5'-cyclic AMP phosphodiesterase CpdA